MRMSKATIILLLSVMICACSSKKGEKIPKDIRKLKNLTVIPANTKSIYQISFKKDAAYGVSKNVVIGNINGIAVGDAGKIFIIDNQKFTIDVFKPDGQYLTHIGRRGKGPGEFGLINQLTVISNKLYAYDWKLERENVFSTDSLALIRTINLKLVNKPSSKALAKYALHTIIPRSDSLFIAQYIPNWYPKNPGYDPENYSLKYYLISNHGKIISSELLKQKGLGFGYIVVNVGGKILRAGGFAFMPHSLIAISNDGHFYKAWDKNFLIKEYNRRGDYLRAFYSSFDNAPLLEDSLLSNYKGIKWRQKMVRNAKLPKTWPALHGLKVDDQHRFWISTIVKDQKVYQWWVLNDQRKLLARFRWPRNKPIEKIKNNNLYTKETNSSGVARIVRYQIKMQ